MKIIKRLFLVLISASLVGVLALYVSGNDYVLTAFKRTYLTGNITANINDYQQFDVRTVATNQKQALEQHPNYNRGSLSDDFVSELDEYGSAAFLVMKDGKLLFEKYMNGYTDRSRTNSFSMAKTVVTLLLGIAIEDGHVDGLDQTIVDFFPEFADDPIGKKATIGQLSLMNSGYEWSEHYYSVFSPTVELLYGDNVEEFLLKGEFSAEPGSFWEYSSASTQLLGIALTRVLRKRGVAQNLSQYLSEKIWQPLQMNDDALWHTDGTGMELAFCCLNTNARNFAKLGQLMLNNGAWQGKQIVPSAFVERMIQPVGQAYYGLSTWLGTDPSLKYYWFSGHLGQYIIVIPSQNIVVVRLGEGVNPKKDLFEQVMPEYLTAVLDLANQK